MARVFRDFIDMIIETFEHAFNGSDAFSGSVMSVGDSIVESYNTPRSQHREVRQAFADAVEALLEAYNAVNHDVIGQVYEQLELQDDNKGQYFTPQDVAELMVRTHMSGTEENNTSEDEATRIHDPCCGSGRVLVEAVCNHDGKVVVSGVDSSPIAAKMAVINFTVMNVEAVIAHGDSLSLDAHQQWKVEPTPLQIGQIAHATDLTTQFEDE